MLGITALLRNFLKGPITNIKSDYVDLKTKLDATTPQSQEVKTGKKVALILMISLIVIFAASIALAETPRLQLSPMSLVDQNGEE